METLSQTLDYGSLPNEAALRLVIQERLDTQTQTLGEGVILPSPSEGYGSGYPFRVDLRGKYRIIFESQNPDFDSSLLEGWLENKNP